MKISTTVMQVLDAAEIDGNRLVLTGQLDRKVYQDVNKVLVAIGGKWNRSAGAHIFDLPVAEVLEPILETGEYSRTKQDFGQFDSPPAVVKRILELAGEIKGKWVLEPSAGVGNIALAAEKAGAAVIEVFEIDASRRGQLKDLNAGQASWNFWGQDFLGAQPGDSPAFDLVLMNPPFARQADIDHVLHAMTFLKPGGRLVAVMSASVMFRTNKKTVAFREFVEAHGGSIEALPDGSFTASGTSVHTCIVSLEA